MFDQLFDSSTVLLEKSLDLRLVRQNVLASNVANAETPGYRALDVNFDEVLQELRDQLESGTAGDSGSLPNPTSSLRLVAADALSLGNDSNTVSLERELGKVSKNALMYKAEAMFLGKKLAMVRDAISGSRD